MPACFRCGPRRGKGFSGVDGLKLAHIDVLDRVHVGAVLLNQAAILVAYGIVKLTLAGKTRVFLRLESGSFTRQAANTLFRRFKA